MNEDKSPSNNVLKLTVTVILLAILLPALCVGFFRRPFDIGVGAAGSPAEPVPPVDVEPLTAPTLDSPGPGDELAGGDVTFSGTGAPNSTVEVIANGEKIGSTTVAEDGTWSMTATIDQPGQVDIVLNALDETGQIAASAEAVTLSLAVPALAWAAPTLNSPDGELTSGEVTLSGTGEPGSTVEIVANGEVIGVAEVDDEGAWSFTGQIDQPGDYEITVNGLDTDGNVYDSTDPSRLSFIPPELDLTLPNVNLPDFNLSPGEFTWRGTGEPGSQVEIVANGEVIGATQVGEDGAWSFSGVFTDPGDYEVVVNTLDTEGNLINSTEPAVVSVEFAVPTLNLPNGDLVSGELALSGTGEPGSEIEILVDGEQVGTTTVGPDGGWSFTGFFDKAGDHEIALNTLDFNGNVTNASEPTLLTIGSPPPPELIAPSSGDTVLAGRITLRGIGQSGREIEVVVNGETLGATTIRANSNWSFSQEVDNPGEYEVVVNALDAEGQVVASSEPVTLVVVEEIAGPEPDSLTEPVDATGFVCAEDYIVVVDDWLSRLSEKFYEDIFLYPALEIATNEKNEVDDSYARIDDPDLIEPGWKLCVVDAETASELTGEVEAGVEAEEN